MSPHETLLVTSTTPSGHLTHKVWVGFLQVVIQLPGGILCRLAMPTDQHFCYWPLVHLPKPSIQVFFWFWLQYSTRVNQGELRQRDCVLIEPFLQQRHMEYQMDVRIFWQLQVIGYGSDSFFYAKMTKKILGLAWYIGIGQLKAANRVVASNKRTHP